MKIVKTLSDCPFSLFSKYVKNLQMCFYCNSNYLKNNSGKAMNEWRKCVSLILHWVQSILCTKCLW